MVREISQDNFETEVLKSEKAIVDFWAPWCGPCHVLAPRFEELSQEIKDVNFFKVNVDDNHELAARYGIRSIPTLLLFKNGEVVGQVIGALPKDSLKQKIEQVFS